ncbi:MAG TPA: cell division protein ZapB [Candidatus Deferrimicrobiaceae bacterium]
MADTTFEAIERRITELVEVVNRLKQEKKAMAGQLDEKDQEIRELGRKMEDLKRERNEIRERVDSILSRLETVEL